jgi:hypothetical protein
MVLAAEWESAVPHAPQRRNVAIQSYEPGVVETDMQKLARSLAPETFPWGGLFHDFVRHGVVVTPAEPAAEIVAFLETDDQLDSLKPAFVNCRAVIPRKEGRRDLDPGSCHLGLDPSSTLGMTPAPSPRARVPPLSVRRFRRPSPVPLQPKSRRSTLRRSFKS